MHTQEWLQQITFKKRCQFMKKFNQFESDKELNGKIQCELKSYLYCKRKSCKGETTEYWLNKGERRDTFLTYACILSRSSVSKENRKEQELPAALWLSLQQRETE